MKKTCENCNAFLRENNMQGWCRARPPVPIIVGMNVSQNKIIGAENGNPMSVPIIQSYFPQMMNSGWCREWQSIEPTKEE